MITEWLISLGLGVVTWIATLFPEWEIPEWVTENQQTSVQLLQSYEGLGVWVDWNALGVAIVATTTVYGVGLSVRGIRAALAHIPQFGGGGA